MIKNKNQSFKKGVVFFLENKKMSSLTILNRENLSRYLLEKKKIEQTNGLNNLDELNLRNYQISLIEANTFNGLNNLKWLYLDREG